MRKMDNIITTLKWGLGVLVVATSARAEEAETPEVGTEAVARPRAPGDTTRGDTTRSEPVPATVESEGSPSAAPRAEASSAQTPPANVTPSPPPEALATTPTTDTVPTSPAPSPAAAVPQPAVLGPQKDESPFGAHGETAELFPRLAVPIRFDGYFWVDTGYMKRTNAQSGQYDQSAAYMQGRYVLGATYYSDKGSLFGLARAQFIGLVNEFSKSQYEPHTLDAYVQAGYRGKFDIQIGRFLAWEVYHRGQGIELFTAEEAGALGGPALYWLDQTRGYKNEAGQFAFHGYPFKFLKFELAGVYGQESNQNNYGLRPVIDFSVGELQLIGGYEYLRQLPQTEADKVKTRLSGAAGKLQYRFPVVTAGANLAWVDVDSVDIQGNTDSSKSYKKLSAGGFVDIDFWKNSIGLGFHHTAQKNERDEHTKHEQMFVSYLIRLPIDGLALKAVYGFASARIEDVDAKSKWTNNMNSFRVRASFDFK